MTSRPQPLRSWRLLALVAGLAGGLAVVERLAGLPSASWPSDTVPRISAAVSALPPGEIASRHPVLSLVMDAADLHDPERGILANVLEHGRDWERPGTVAYFDDGQLRFATGVGVRIHGGGSRKSSPRQGFRLYFRREYGARQLPPDVLFSTDAQPVRHLVIHNDVRDGRHFANPLAYDIAREVGAITAETSPVRFFLNGEFYGVFVLTERFDEQYFRAHWGHDRIDWTDEEMQSFWEWSVQHRPMTMADVATKADVEGLARWFLATAFMATRDAYQGPGQYLDSSRTPPRWFWVNWDMDGSFRSFDLDSYADLLNRVDELQRGRSHTEPRSNLLTTLFAEDDAFRTFYKRLFVAAMNHHLTPEFLDRRLDYYRRAGQQLGVTETKYLREYATFIERRPAVLQEVDRELAEHGPKPTTGARPAGRRVNHHRRGSGTGWIRGIVLSRPRDRASGQRREFRTLGSGRRVERDGPNTSPPSRASQVRGSGLSREAAREDAPAVESGGYGRASRAGRSAFMGSRHRAGRRDDLSDAHARSHGRGLQRVRGGT